MAESIVQVATGGTGPKLHTWQTTIGGNNVEDEFVIPGEYPYASYTAIAQGVSIATLNDHLLQLMAGPSLKVRIRRIRLEQRANATSATATPIEIRRLTTAGTGGTVVTPAPFDTSDPASGATAMTQPTSKGTESTVLAVFTSTWRQAVSATGSPTDDAMYEWTQHPGQKPIIIPAGATNGICLKHASNVAGATVTVTIEFVETSY